MSATDDLPPPHSEGALLLAFVDVMEQRRLLGHLQGWRVTRDDRYCWLEMMSAEGVHFVARGATFEGAKNELADQLIAAGMTGAPLA
jgi:hypothetical protein